MEIEFGQGHYSRAGTSLIECVLFEGWNCDGEIFFVAIILIAFNQFLVLTFLFYHRLLSHTKIIKAALK